MDLDRLCGSPSPLSVGDATYRAAPLTYGQLGSVQRWLRESGSRLRVGVDPGWLDAALADAAGRVHFVWVALEPHRPGLALAEARAVASQLTRAGFDALLRVALDLRDDDEDDGGPPAPRDVYGAAARALYQAHGILPPDVARMTPRQLAGLGEPAKAVFRSVAEAKAHYDREQARKGG